MASRISRGASRTQILTHTFKRSLILIFLGIFLRSLHSNQTNFTFEDTLTQIGLGYTFLVLLAFYSQRTQLITLVFILVGYWLAFAIYPLPGADFDYALAGAKPDWVFNFEGFSAHWNKNTNLAWAFDQWFMNLFPRENPYLYSSGGYVTLSFIPTLGTMILGLLAGNILKSSRVQSEKLRRFITIGLALVLIGVLLHVSGINPIVKRIWTPAWTLFSGGICFMMLAFFYGVIDVAGNGKWSYFLMIIGVNSIAAYVIADGGMKNYISDALFTHLGQNFNQLLGTPYESFVSGSLILLVEWLILYWMYKRKIFIKV